MKHPYSLVYVLLAVALILSLVPCASAQSADGNLSAATATAYDEQAAIQKPIERYFTLQHQILSKLDCDDRLLQEAQSLTLAHSAFQTKLDTTLRMAVAHRRAQRPDLTYSAYDFALRYQKQSVEGSTAVVSVFVTERIRFHEDPATLSESGSLHTLTLQREGDAWFLTNDQCAFDGYGAAYDRLTAKASQKGLDPAETGESVLSAFQQEIDADVAARNLTEARDENAPDVGADSPELRLVAHNYDPSDPVDYAHTYCRTDNPDPWITYSADCTNFTSIALHQNIPMDTSGSSSSRKWYFYSRTNKTASWTASQYFRVYIYKNNNSTSSNSGIYGKHDTYANCGLGDIVQYCSDPDDLWSEDNRPISTHSSIVTKVRTIGGTKTLYVSMHSYDSNDSDYRYDYIVDAMPYTAKHYLNIVRYYS